MSDRMHSAGAAALAVSVLAISGLVLSAQPALAQDKPAAAPAEEKADWFPSRYGAEDRLGAANNLSAEKTKAAAALVTRGKAVGLGIITGRTTPAYPPRGYNIHIVAPGFVDGNTIGPTQTTANDDILNTWVGIGTQLDGLGHVGINYRYYNGLKAGEFVDVGGLKQLGTHTIPPFATRGVLLDIAGQMGKEMLEAGTPINKAEIDAAAEKAGVMIEKGDVVILHTGWMGLLEKDPKTFGAAEPGLGLEGARYLAEKGVVAIGADTWGLEVVPFEKGAGVFEVHQILLSKNGVYILENLNIRPLIDDKVTEFFFVVGAPRFEGAVQMVVNPVALY